MDTCVQVKEDGSTKITVFRNPTDTDQYHPLEHKRSVLPTLLHRTENIIIETNDKKRRSYIKDALSYPDWILRSPRKGFNDNDKSKKEDRHKINIDMSYVRSTSETLR